MSTAFEAAVARQGQAQETSRSVWVAASAGAGKTRVLTSRIVRLLLEGADPASILALTYTKAAAKEMATRVISTARDLATADAADRLAQVTALLGYSPAPEVLVRAGALYEVILDTPGGLLIQTIHAFCQSLLGRFPFEAGLTPGFEAIEEDARAELLAQACAQVLRRQSDRFAALKAAARPETLTALADVLVRQDWQQMLPRHGSTLFETAEARPCGFLLWLCIDRCCAQFLPTEVRRWAGETLLSIALSWLRHFQIPATRTCSRSASDKPFPGRTWRPPALPNVGS